MAPDARKRAADVPCDNPSISKWPRILDSEVMPFATEHRSISNLANRRNPSTGPLKSAQSCTTAHPKQDIEFRLPSNAQTMNLHASQSLSLHGQQHSGTSSKSGTMPAPLPTVHKPVILHQQHPDSRLCQDFHWVPYPLGLMSFDSWHRLHHGEDMQPSLPARCPVCRQERIATTHMRKLFLVAERLTWDDRLVWIHEKDLNEELNVKVNYELGILNPFVEEPEQILGGRNSRNNKFYPYQNEHEMKLAMKLIFMTNDITATTWALWISTQLHLQKMLDEDHSTGSPRTASGSTSIQVKHELTSSTTSGRQKTPVPIDTIDLTVLPEPASRIANGKWYWVPTPPSSLAKVAHGITSSKEPRACQGRFASMNGRFTSPPQPKRIESYKSLQDFYSLLDRIERTSYVGALFLEAYAEKLRDDMCKSCWLKHNVKLDLF
jgi:hypothetical protein